MLRPGLIPNRRRLPKEYDQAMARIREMIVRQARPFEDMSPEAVERRQRLPFARWMRKYFPHWISVPDAPFHAEADERRNIVGIPVTNCWGGGMGKTVRYVILDALYDICNPVFLWTDEETGERSFAPEWLGADEPNLLKGDRLIHSAVGCHTFDSAATKTDIVRLELLHNARLRADYGDALEPRQGQSEEGDFVSNGHRLFARGIGQSLRGELFHGRRVQKLRCDDLENERIGYNREAEAKLRKQVFNDWYPRLEGSGARAALSAQTNMYGPHCFAEFSRELSEKLDEAGRPGSLYIREPWEDENGESRWAEQITTEELKGIRLRIGDAAYRSQYLCLVANENAIFQPQWFLSFSVAKLRRDAPEQIAAMRKVVWHDTSWLATEASDFKATIALGMPRNEPKILTLHAWIRKVSGKEAARHLCKVHAMFPDATIWIEGNGGAEMAYRALYELMVKDGLEPGYWRYETNTDPKDARVMQWIGEVSRGDCFFDVEEGDQRLLVDQFCDWGQPGAKRDGPDAWACARIKLGRFGGTRIEVATAMPRDDMGALVGLGRSRRPPPRPGSRDDRWQRERERLGLQSPKRALVF